MLTQCLLQVPDPLLRKPLALIGDCITAAHAAAQPMHVIDPAHCHPAAHSGARKLASHWVTSSQVQQAKNISDSIFANWQAAEAAPPPTQAALSALRRSCMQPAGSTVDQSGVSKPAESHAAGATSSGSQGMPCSHAAVTVTVANTANVSNDRPSSGGASEPGASRKMCWPGSGAHVEVMAPAAWGCVLLPELVRAGAVAVGMREWRAVRAMCGASTFPFDYVACAAYWCASSSRKRRRGS